MSKIWAHRGASGYAPENTLEAFRLAVQMGAHGVELDVHLSRDGELIVMHDETVDRTSNAHGRIADMTLSELKALDVSMGKRGYEGAKVPTLSEVYALLKPSGISINVELKCDIIRYEGICEKLCALEKEMGMQGRILYSSFNHYVLKDLRALAPDAKVGLLYECGIFEPWKYAKDFGADALHPYYRSLCAKGVIEGCREHGIALHPWTVNEEQDLRFLIEKGVDAVITNFPDRALAILRKNDCR